MSNLSIETRTTVYTKKLVWKRSKIACALVSSNRFSSEENYLAKLFWENISLAKVYKMVKELKYFTKTCFLLCATNKLDVYAELLTFQVQETHITFVLFSEINSLNTSDRKTFTTGTLQNCWVFLNKNLQLTIRHVYVRSIYL